LTERRTVRQHGLPVIDLSAISREAPAVVFVNPLAGAGRAGKYLVRVREVFETQKIHVEFVLTQNEQVLGTRFRTAVAAGCRLFFAMGGDGTFHGLINAAYGADVVLGVLPAGGGNDFASALGVPRDPVTAARAVLRGQPRPVDLVCARTGDGRKRLYAGGGGMGLDVEAAQFAAGAFRRWPGRLRYVASALLALHEFKPLRVHLEFPGSELPAIDADVLLAAVLNSPTYGAGLRLAPGARLDDGSLEVVCVRELGALQVLALLLRLLLNGALPPSYLKRVQARKVLLQADRPCFFQGDGEILGPTVVEIEVVPAAVHVLAPAAG
jgi:diacylglycerol kinase (ATP)